MRVVADICADVQCTHFRRKAVDYGNSAMVPADYPTFAPDSHRQNCIGGRWQQHARAR